MLNALIDYDGWMRSERWDMGEEEAKAKATEMVKDRQSPVEMVQIFRGSYLLFHKRNYSKTYACHF